MTDSVKRIRERLFALQDIKYRDFQCALIPTVNKETVIGVRTPELRKFARELAKAPDAAEFLSALPHEYYDENNLHGFLIETIKDFDETTAAIDAFLPYVDNWATCDTMSPKSLKKDLPRLLEKIRGWIASGKTYTVRFGIEMLMSYFLDENFNEEYLALAAVPSEEYYVKMMVAWFFATALAKQYDAACFFIEQKKLDVWTHNKAIQKAVESRRLTDEQKKYLKTLKIK